MLDMFVNARIARDLSARQFADGPRRSAAHRRAARSPRPALPSAAARCASCAGWPTASSPPRAAPRSPDYSTQRSPSRMRRRVLSRQTPVTISLGLPIMKSTCIPEWLIGSPSSVCGRAGS